MMRESHRWRGRRQGGGHELRHFGFEGSFEGSRHEGRRDLRSKARQAGSARSFHWCALHARHTRMVQDCMQRPPTPQTLLCHTRAHSLPRVDIQERTAA